MTGSVRHDVDDQARGATDWRGASTLTQFRVLSGRTLRASLADRRIALFGLLQPLIMLLLFSQVFGSMVDTGRLPGGVGYIEYLMPALLVTTAIGTAPGSGVTLVREMEGGLVARLRSLPIRLSMVLAARSVADLARNGFELTALLVCGVVLFGFRPAGGVLGVLAALLVALLVSWTLVWVFLAVGACLRSTELIQSIGFLVLFPLMFASSAFAPLEGLPGWLRAVATVNPMTYAVDACRALALGQPAGAVVAGAVLSSGAVIVLAVLFGNRGITRPRP